MDRTKIYPTPEERMDFVIHLAQSNVSHQTGGPFGAAVFDMDTHQLISIGMNLVISSHCSSNHAEIVALTFAQQTLNSFSLNAEGLPRCELVSSSEPCAMCFGAVPWSGIRYLSCGATAKDAESIGFDEGPKHPNWVQELEKRGITVATEIKRKAAAQVLQNYHNNHGLIYNA